MKYLAIIIIFASLLGNSIQSSTSGDKKFLNQARRDLLLAEETYQRVTLEFQKLRENKDIPVEILADYKTYISRIHKMANLYRLRVKRIEAGTLQETSNEDLSQLDDFRPVVKDEQTHVDSLVREFNDSLGAFDEFILQEISKIDQENSEPVDEQELNGLAGEAAKAVQRLKRNGIELYPSDVTGRGGENSPKNQSLTKQIEIPAGTDDEETTNGIIATLSQNIGPVADDDIVARQLREAAEKETDPILKEKLWQEYKAYKHAVRKQLTPISKTNKENSDDKVE